MRLGGLESDRKALSELQEEVYDAIGRTHTAASNLDTKSGQSPRSEFRAQRIYKAMVECDREVLYANIDWVLMLVGNLKSAVERIDDRPKQTEPEDKAKAAFLKLIERAKSVSDCVKTDGEPAYVDLEDLAMAVLQAEESLK